MYWNKRIQTAKIGYILISLMLCALGVVLIVCPGVSAGLLCKISGVIMVLFGAIKIIGYFSKDLYRLAFQFDLSLGLMLAVLGVIILRNPDQAMSFLCLMLGIATENAAAQVAADCLRDGLMVLTAKDKVRLLPALNIPMAQLE